MGEKENLIIDERKLIAMIKRMNEERDVLKEELVRKFSFSSKVWEDNKQSMHFSAPKVFALEFFQS